MQALSRVAEDPVGGPRLRPFELNLDGGVRRLRAVASMSGTTESAEGLRRVARQRPAAAAPAPRFSFMTLGPLLVTVCTLPAASIARDRIV